MPISDELKKIYATAPVTDYYIETLILEHSEFTDGVQRITNQNGGWVGYDEDDTMQQFTYLPFTTVPPSSAEEAAVTLTVGIDNANGVFMDQLERLGSIPSEPIIMTYGVYLRSDPAVLQNNPPFKLNVLSITATQNIVSFSASLTNLRDRPFPSMLYDTVRFPGLER